ncbi:MAG: glycosyltransferase [Weeksellaceae bacterium]
MQLPVYVYDPTLTDTASQVRGIGRYLLLLQENFGTEWQFVSDTTKIPYESTVIQPFFNLIVPSPLKKRIARRQIAVIHDLIPAKYPKFFPIGWKGKWHAFWNLRHLRKDYDLIIAVSETTKQDTVTHLKIPAQKIQVVYNTIPRIMLPHLDKTGTQHPFHQVGEKNEAAFNELEPNEIISNPQIKELAQFAIYVGDATWNKNLVNLAYAIKGAQIPCVFVGKVFTDMAKFDFTQKPHPWQKSLYDFAKLVQHDPLFIFPGYVSDIELKALYSRAQLNILVSYDEGFGFSFLEAGYASCPSILSDRPIFHETAGAAADYANPMDAKDIAQKINALFYDQVKHEKLSIEAFSRAQDFSPERFKQAWTAVVTG